MRGVLPPNGCNVKLGRWGSRQSSNTRVVCKLFPYPSQTLAPLATRPVRPFRLPTRNTVEPSSEPSTQSPTRKFAVRLSMCAIMHDICNVLSALMLQTAPRLSRWTSSPTRPRTVAQPPSQWMPSPCCQEVRRNLIGLGCSLLNIIYLNQHQLLTFLLSMCIIMSSNDLLLYIFYMFTFIRFQVSASITTRSRVNGKIFTQIIKFVSSSWSWRVQ
jgi:hypothetical protein